MKFTENTLFKDYAVFWLENYVRGFVKDNTYMGTYYRQTHNALIPYFGNMAISDIKSSIIQEFFNIQGKRYSLETMKKMRFCLSNILQVAVDDEIISKNPLNKRIRLKSNIEPIEKHVWNREHFECAYRFALVHPQGLGPLLLMDTAISRSELLGITWNDIIWEKAAVAIRNGTIATHHPDTKKYYILTDGLKNKYRMRNIPLSKDVCNRLKLHYQHILFSGQRKGLTQNQINKQFVISNQKGGAMDPNNWAKRNFRRFMNDLTSQYPEIPVLTPHELRHTRATLWWQEGVDLLSIGFAGGWSDLRMLRERYAHSNIEHLKKALKR